MCVGTTASAVSGAQIWCSIDGFGPQGPLKALPARDLLVAAHAGTCADQHGWAPGPSYPVHQVRSIGAGLLAVQGIVAALFERGRTGRGEHVRTSLFAASLAMSGRVEADHPFRDRGLSTQARGTSPLYAMYSCSDGRWIQFGCLHGAFVERAIEALGIEEAVRCLRVDPGFGDGVAPTTDSVRRPFYGAVAKAVRSRTQSEWLRILLAADVPVAPVLRDAEFLDDPQGRANGVVLTVDQHRGSIGSVGHSVRVRPYVDGEIEPSPSDEELEPSVPPTGRRRKRPRSQRWRSRDASESGPLSGTTIVEIGNVIAGPMAGRFLADLGATVVKLEPLTGDIFRQQAVPEFHPLNAGKLGIAIDLKTGPGRDAAVRLVDRADVLLSNLRPDALSRLGLGEPALRKGNRNLVFCQVSAFGSSGPYAARPGGDPLAGAYTGMQSAQGRRGKPVYIRGAPIDYTAALLATAGILLALVARQRSGRGQRVDTSLLDAGALLNAPALVRRHDRLARSPMARTQYRRDALTGLYELPGGWVAIAVASDAEWTALAIGLGEPRLDRDQRFTTRSNRARHDGELSQEIAARLRSADVAIWERRLARLGVPATRVLRTDELGLMQRTIAANGLATVVHDPHLGPLRIADGWLQFSRLITGCRAPAPALGADTPRVLDWLGYGSHAIERLIADSVVGVGVVGASAHESAIKRLTVHDGLVASQ
jgi:crotonobetainyl-CoA:carnitine CoA-transferase CaiB-like acyl-CoA transferase